MSRYIKGASEGVKPDPIFTVSQWADTHRILSRVSSAEPGQWKTSRTPFLREIMDDLSISSPVLEIYFMKGSQIGGTEIGNNWMGYIIDHAPGPTLSVVPRLEDAKKNSKIRLAPLIESSPRLREKVKDAKSRDSGNTILQKDFPGGTIIMAGSNSPAGLRSMPIRNLFFDEEDGYVLDSGGEGCPVELAKKRTSTFSSKKKIFHCSTPTIEDRSKIEEGYNSTSQRKYFVPCPKCGHMQWLQWQQLKWEWGLLKTVYYECINEDCKRKIKNWEKTKMLTHGEWRDTSKGKNPLIKGYHLSGLYSPVGWVSWADLVEEWEQAKDSKNIEKLKTFINTRLGESWKDKGEAPEWKKLYLRREIYKANTIPNGVCFLTAGVDIQKDRIEVEIVGWGRHKISWSIDYRVFEGDTSSIDNPVWLELHEILAEVWTAPNNVDLPVKLMAVDSGYNTQTVYSWVRKFPISKCVAIKGSDTQSVMIGVGKPVDVKLSNLRTTIRRGLKLFLVGVSIVKAELYGWLKMEPANEGDPDAYGFCHFPEYDEDHFKRLTSETLETKWVKGKKKYEWVAHGRNEQLDCRVYARAAACLIGIDRFKEAKWDALELEVGFVSKRQSSENVQKSEKKRIKTTIKRRKSNFT